LSDFKKKKIENHQIFVPSSSNALDNIGELKINKSFHSFLVCSHIYFIHLMDDFHFSYSTKLGGAKKKKE
jgi:hypothetical protein